ncbi:MAG: hypothetical protein HY741_04180 [Chloroflexi bacterium]|nr:hypothetical protein [Chloroflexota bacterium]
MRPRSLFALVALLAWLLFGGVATASSGAAIGARFSFPRNTHRPLLLGDTWQPLGFGVDDTVYAVVANGSEVYVGGDFTQLCGEATCTSGNVAANAIAKWNGSAWSPLGNGVNGSVYAIVASGSTLYIGGDFTQICGDASCTSGNTNANYLAQWNGSAWQPVGNGVNNTVQALAWNGSELYVGGWFTQVCGSAACTSGNVTANAIARWNGSAWSTLGNGVDDTVQAIALNGAEIYVGGWFTQVCGDATCTTGNVTANALAKWNGSAWSTLGNGFNSPVQSVAPSGSQLYVGGWFTELCGNATCDTGNTTANHIAQWNGSAWQTLGNGVDNSVETIVVNGTEIVAGGWFTEFCGNALCSTANTSANAIAKWNGVAWSMFGNGVDNPVQAIALSGGETFAGGWFTQLCGNATCNASNTAANRVAKYAAPAGSTPTSTATRTATATVTATRTGTAIATGTHTATATATRTGTAIATATHTATRTGTAIATAIHTATATATPTETLVPPDATATFTLTATSENPCAVAPSKPVLNSPENGATLNTQRVMLKWQQAACAETYTVTVKDIGAGKAAYKKANLTTLQHKTKALARNRSYKWFVKACNANGCARSAIFKFKIE